MTALSLMALCALAAASSVPVDDVNSTHHGVVHPATSGVSIPGQHESMTLRSRIPLSFICDGYSEGCPSFSDDVESSFSSSMSTRASSSRRTMTTTVVVRTTEVVTSEPATPDSSSSTSNSDTGLQSSTKSAGSESGSSNSSSTVSHSMTTPPGENSVSGGFSGSTGHSLSESTNSISPQPSSHEPDAGTTTVTRGPTTLTVIVNASSITTHPLLSSISTFTTKNLGNSESVAEPSATLSQSRAGTITHGGGENATIILGTFIACAIGIVAFLL